MGYHADHAQSFGSSYLSDIAKRKAFISKGCTAGVVDPNAELCQYPLFTKDRVSVVNPSQGEGKPAMFDLRLLHRRHNQIAEWIENTNNKVDISDNMIMRPNFYSLEGKKINVAQRGSNEKNYLQRPQDLNVKVGKANNEAYTMSSRPPPSSSYYDQMDRASAPSLSSVRQWQNLSLNDQLREQQRLMDESFEDRQELRGEARQNSFGYSGSETKGTMLKRLADRKGLISSNCHSGKEGFEEACDYPLYRNSTPLPTSTWSYPRDHVPTEMYPKYPFHIKKR